MALREVLAHFGIEVEGEELKKFDSLLDGVKEKLTAFGQILGGAALAHGFTSFIEGQIEAGSRLADTSAMLGIAADDLQRFELAAGLAGASTEAVSTGLRFLNKNMGEAVSGSKEAVASFAELGVSVKDAEGGVRPLTDVAIDVADALEGYESAAERTALAMKVLGKGGAALLPFFQQGGDAVREALADLDALGGGLSEEFVAAADEAGDEVDRFKTALSSLKSGVATPFLPVVAAMAKSLAELTGRLARVAKETEIIRVSVASFGLLLGGVLVQRLNKFTSLLRVFGALNSVIPHSRAELGKLALTLARYGGVVAIAAAFAVLALVVEDLMVAFEGGDSLIGRVLTQLYGADGATQIIADLKAGWDQAVDAFRVALPDLKEVGRVLVSAFADALPALASFVIGLAKGIAAAVQLATAGGKAIASALKGDFTHAGQIIDQAGNKVFGVRGLFAGALSGPATVTLADGRQVLKGGSEDPTVNVSRGATGRTASIPYKAGFAPGNPRPSGPLTQRNEVNIVVQGAPDPKATARAIAGTQTDVAAMHSQTLAMFLDERT